MLRPVAGIMTSRSFAELPDPDAAEALDGLFFLQILKNAAAIAVGGGVVWITSHGPPWVQAAGLGLATAVPAVFVAYMFVLLVPRRRLQKLGSSDRRDDTRRVLLSEIRRAPWIAIAIAAVVGVAAGLSN